MYFGRMPLALEVGERRGHRVGAHAVAVERDADHVHAHALHAVDRALVGLLLEQHGVAARQQRAIDQVERLQRAGRHQDVVGGAGNAGVTLELADQEIAQPPVALRAVGEAVGRERAAFPRHHRVGRGNQSVERDRVAVVVAPGEIVLGQPGPARCGGRQVRWQQRREIERCHALLPTRPPARPAPARPRAASRRARRAARCRTRCASARSDCPRQVLRNARSAARCRA